jgi:hypothetical protein
MAGLVSMRVTRGPRGQLVVSAFRQSIRVLSTARGRHGCTLPLSLAAERQLPPAWRHDFISLSEFRKSFAL